MIRLLNIILIVFMFSLAFAKGHQEIYIIVNSGIKDTVISKSKIIDIYTLNRLYWDDGKKIVVIDHKGNSKIKEKYYSFLDIDYSGLQKIWLRKQFSGKAMPPLTFRTEDEIIDEVASTKGAIAYVSTKPKNKRIKVLAVIDTHED